MSDKHSPSPPRSRSASQAKGSDDEMKSPARADVEMQQSEDQETSRRSRSPVDAATTSATSTAAAATSDAVPDREDKTVGENPGNNLYVANLATRVGQPELQELFEKYGRVSKCEVIVDPVTRESRGFGFVAFEDVRDAEDAVKELHECGGKEFCMASDCKVNDLGPRLASAKYGGRDRHSGDRNRDRGRRSRSRDRGGFSRRTDDRDHGRSNDRGRGRYDDRDRSRGGYSRDMGDDRRRR